MEGKSTFNGFKHKSLWRFTIVQVGNVTGPEGPFYSLVSFYYICLRSVFPAIILKVNDKKLTEYAVNKLG